LEHKQAFCSVLAAKMREMDPLAQAVSRGECVQGLGAVCSELVHSARSALKEQAAAGLGEEAEAEDVHSSDELRKTFTEKVRFSPPATSKQTHKKSRAWGC
jgi:hypothetical protein